MLCVMIFRWSILADRNARSGNDGRVEAENGTTGGGPVSQILGPRSEVAVVGQSCSVARRPTLAPARI